MARILIKNGRLVDPASKIDAVKDLLIEGNKIVRIGSRLSVSGARVIDAKKMLVLPGLIDMHAHLRDPGRPDKETIASGTRAAAKGGFTTVCCMANTDPVVDTPAVVRYIRSKAQAEAVVNVLPVAAVSRGLQGDALSEMGLMLEEGAVAFSDDGNPVMKAQVLRRALEYASQFGAVIISHCEDKGLSQAGVMNESALSTKIGLPGIPSLSEEIMVARDIMLAKEYGRVHIAHVSSANSVELIRRAKRERVNITCETCPHYFSLTQEAVSGYDTNARVNPPLKSARDVKEIVKGLKDGTIDVIATDHAPHNIEEKKVEFNSASSGMVGLETALALSITKLVDDKGDIPLKRVVEAFTASPARILKLDKGTLKAGKDADVIVVDPKSEWTVDPGQFASKSKNTPFSGWKLKGRVLYTIVGGKVVVRDGKLLA